MSDQQSVAFVSERPEWTAETLRVSAFATAGSPFSFGRWKAVFGTEPNEVLRQPGQPFTEAGIKDNSRWVLGQMHDRLDILMTPAGVGDPLADIPNVGKFDTALGSLRNVAQTALRSEKAIQRLAIGAVLYFEVASIRDGLEAIGRMVPHIVKLPPDTKDFTLQINVPGVVKLGTSDVQINRLVKWQLVRAQLFTASMTGSMPTQFTAVESRFLVRLELDFNSPAERATPIQGEEIIELLSALMAAVKNFALNAGDSNE